MPANSVNAADTDFSVTSGELVRASRVLQHPGFVENIGISYNGGTGVFSVTGADGTALSSSNPGYVVLQSSSVPGTLITYTVTADQSFTDDVGTSDIVGNLFGYTTSVAITVDVPFFLYAVGNDDEDAVAFMCSRVPHYNTSPASANIGTPASAAADIQGSFFAFDSITTTAYDSNPCVSIGSFRMQMSASDDWTVQTLSISDGIGNFNEATAFTNPLGQFGANSGTYTIAGGGTAPVFSSVTGTYRVRRDGVCSYQLFQNGDGGTDGAGAVAARCTLPYQTEGRPIGSVLLKLAGGNFLTGLTQFAGSTSPTTVIYQNNTGVNSINWSAFGAGDRFWRQDNTFFIA